MLATNQVLKLGSPAWISVPDEGANSRFDFDNGDAITLEVWVRVTSTQDNVYLVGKGRTYKSGKKTANQN
jgi:hypothetical protein